MSILLSVALSAALLLQQAAPSTSPQDESTTVEGLVVTAKPVPATEAITAFVADVSAETGAGRLGRWDRKVCPGVIGVKETYAQALVDHIGAAAVKVGLEVGEPGCKPNIIILGTADADLLTKTIVSENPDAFSKYDSGLTRGRKALNAFIASDEPVRWWHVIRRVTADGQPYDAGDQVRVRDIGRLRANSRDDFTRVIIVLDARRAGVLRFTALADYIAMVGLAQIDPEASAAGVPTILNLFADRDAGVEPPAGLTDWDLAYLRGLYGAKRDAPTGKRQEQDVVRTMAKDLASPAPAPKPE